MCSQHGLFLADEHLLCQDMNRGLIKCTFVTLKNQGHCDQRYL